MKTKCLAVVWVVVLGAGPVLAQPANPYWRTPQGLTQAQYLQNLLATQQAMLPLVPPVNPGGGGFINPYTPSIGGGFVNPYTPGGGAGASLPSPFPYGGGGYPYSFIPPEGYFLQGAAAVMNAYGNVLTSSEQARLMREQALQARIETAKKRFEYELYVKANTPTYTEIQAKIAKDTLKRIQNTNNVTEIWSGRAPKILLDDLKNKVLTKKVSVDPIPLSEDVLQHLNIMTGRSGNLGLLRNQGRFTWPPVLSDLLTKEDREQLEKMAALAVNKATNGADPGNLVPDMQSALEKAREALLQKVNEIPTTQYIQAKRFLNDFDAAALALSQKDNAIKYFQFQKWASGGKTIQEVVDYMTKEGLEFAPAVQGDESAYQALNSALQAYNIAFNNQIAAVAGNTTKE